MGLRASGLFAAFLAVSCSGVDRAKFEPAYRAGKALEVEISSGVNMAEAERLLKAFQTEVAMLNGRANGQKELDCFAALDSAAAAFKDFLDIRSLDLRGDARADGRLLVGDAWASRAARFNVSTQPDEKPDPNSQYKWIWLNTSEALKGFHKAAIDQLAAAGRLLNE
jgi:hypothetical protein